MIHLGNAAGSGNDLIARLYCQRLSDAWASRSWSRTGQLRLAIAGDTSPGRCGRLHADFRHAPDGEPRSSMQASFSTERTSPRFPWLEIPIVLISNRASITSVRELIDYAKANPQKPITARPAPGCSSPAALSRRGRRHRSCTFLQGRSQVVNAVAAGDVMMALVDAGSATGPR